MQHQHRQLKSKLSYQQQPTKRSQVTDTYKQTKNTEVKECLPINSQGYLGVYRIKVQKIQLQNTNTDKYHYFLNFSLGKQTYKQHITKNQQNQQKKYFSTSQCNQFYFQRKAQQTLVLFISNKQKRPNSAKNKQTKKISSQLQNNNNLKSYLPQIQNQKYAQLLLTPFVILQNQHNVKIHMVERTAEKKILGNKQAGTITIKIQYLASFKCDIFVELIKGSITRDTTFVGQVCPQLTFQTIGYKQQQTNFTTINYEQATKLIKEHQDKNIKNKNKLLFRVRSPLNYIKIQAFHQYILKDILGEVIIDWRLHGIQNLIKQMQYPQQTYKLKYQQQGNINKQQQNIQNKQVQKQKKVAGEIKLAFRIGYRLNLKVNNQTNQKINISPLKTNNSNVIHPQIKQKTVNEKSCQKFYLQYLIVPQKQQNNNAVKESFQIKLSNQKILILSFNFIKKSDKNTIQQVQLQPLPIITKQLKKYSKDFSEVFFQKQFQVKLKDNLIFLIIKNHPQNEQKEQ